MPSGSDPLAASSSFMARRPHASNLPNFELPPPQLSNLQQKYPPSTSASASQPSASPAHLSSVGNLLTPPSNLPGDAQSPNPSSMSNNASNGPGQSNVAHYTPNGYLWAQQQQQQQQSQQPQQQQQRQQPLHSQPPQQQQQSSNTYAYQASSGQQTYSSSRPLMSSAPVNQPTRAVSSPSPTDQVPSGYEVNQTSYPASAPLSTPTSLPALSTQQQHVMNLIHAQTPVSASPSHPSPISAQDGFTGQRHHSTSTYYSHPSSTPQQNAFPYSSGPSPTLQSPMSAGPLSRMSPPNSAGPLSAGTHQGAHPYHRQFGSFSLPGPGLSGMSNGSSQLSVVNGIPHSMIQPYNGSSNVHPVFGSHNPSQSQTPSDRPFKCDQCPQSFNRNHDLKRHKRIHLAVKPFPCGYCEKSFSRKDALKRHMLVKGCGQPAPASENDKASSKPDSPAVKPAAASAAGTPAPVAQAATPATQ